MMKYIMSLLTIACTFLVSSGFATEKLEADALKNTMFTAKELQEQPSLAGFNEANLEGRAEFLSMHLYATPALKNNLPEDPTKRISILVERVNAAKAVWLKKLELEEALQKFHAVAMSTGAPGGFGEIKAQVHGMKG
jgi:hypothetical protein